MSLSDTNIVVLLIYFLALVIFSFSRMKSSATPGKLTFLLRAFLPSWKFFEDCEYAPLLLYRIRRPGEDFQSWVPCLEKPKRRWGTILFNPDGNFLLMSSSLIMQLVGDLDAIEEHQAEKLTKSVSFQLTKNLVRFQILKAGVAPPGLHFQFKLSALFPTSPERTPEDMLISPVYEA